MHRQVSATYERHRVTYIAYGWTPLDRQTWQSWHDLDIANGHAIVGCDCHKGGNDHAESRSF
jgi:hypothetical protein